MIWRRTGSREIRRDVYSCGMSPAAQLGFILENIGGGEIIVIAFLALVVLGPERIPEMARGAGRMIHNLKKLTSDLTGDMKDVINDPAMQPIKELGEFAVRPRQKLAEYALEAEAEERTKAAATAQPPEAPEEPDAVPEEGPKADAEAPEEPDAVPEEGPKADAEAPEVPTEASADTTPSPEATTESHTTADPSADAGGDTSITT